MDPYSNPFAPGAGSRPPELAGRDDVLEQAKIACGRALKGRSARSLMLLGLRGTGKTVLLNEIGRQAKDLGMLVAKVEAPEGESLARLLYPEMRKTMRSLSTVDAAKQIAERGLRGLRSFASVFNISVAGVEVGVEPEAGLADSGNMQYDLPDLFRSIGEAAQQAEKGWVVLVDEVQYLSDTDLSALIVAMHQMSQERLPVVFVGAGLPQIAKLAGEAKSYAERLFAYPTIGPLEQGAASEAIEKPVRDEGALITADAVSKIVMTTEGYPFYLQEWASNAWDKADASGITLEVVEETEEETIHKLDEGFFRVRMDRLTKAEIRFVQAMAELGDGPYALSDIAELMGRKIQHLSPARKSIIDKGMIYSTDHGFLDFTVPLFANYMRRQRSTT